MWMLPATLVIVEFALNVPGAESVRVAVIVIAK
jgi:hypothetical protein